MSLSAIASSLRNMVSRGKVTGSGVGARTFIQVTGLHGELKQMVELLLPPGMSAKPRAGADVVLLQVLGQRDHLIALGGDFAGQDAINDLEPGEFGFRFADGMIVWRTDYIQIVHPMKVRVEAPRFECTGTIVPDCDG